MNHNEICHLLALQKKEELDRTSDEGPVNPTIKRVEASIKVAASLLTTETQQKQKSYACKSVMVHAMQKPNVEKKTIELQTDNPSIISTATITERQIKENYLNWCQKTYEKDNTEKKIPNEKQKMVLNEIHTRCLIELYSNQQTNIRPLLRLVHGLPGSGKSELLRWIRSYFQDVMKYSEGEEFIFVAPLNSMAANISGRTLHSWGKIAFKDKQGRIITPNDGDAEQPILNKVTGRIRYIFMDEVEAANAEIIGQLEHNVRFHISDTNIFRCNSEGEVRIFGGVNVFFFGDFWQLRPAGIAIMSNPFADSVLGNAAAKSAMDLFWSVEIEKCLQPWNQKDDSTARLLHLDVNIRSGADKWFSEVLNQCRAGCLTMDNYNFLHGYPTKKRIEYWYRLIHL